MTRTNREVYQIFCKCYFWQQVKQKGIAVSQEWVQLHLISAVLSTLWHSGSASHHCKQDSVSPALLPAWAGPRVISCQDFSIYIERPLQTACLAGESHPRVECWATPSKVIHHPAGWQAQSAQLDYAGKLAASPCKAHSQQAWEHVLLCVHSPVFNNVNNDQSSDTNVPVVFWAPLKSWCFTQLLLPRNPRAQWWHEAPQMLGYCMFSCCYTLSMP